MLGGANYKLGKNAFDDDGIMVDKNKKPISGLVREYSTGRLVSETEYKNGLLNGMRKVYHTRGQNTLWYEIPYINNKKQGLSQRYYESYSAGEKNKLLGLIPYVNGKKHGKEIWYYRDGGIETEIEYSNGKKNGSQKIYNRSGILVKELFFRNGKEIGAE
jgi:antitoxin component YwqK of YwqJK toxin-antitoxin module